MASTGYPRMYDLSRNLLIEALNPNIKQAKQCEYTNRYRLGKAKLPHISIRIIIFTIVPKEVSQQDVGHFYQGKYGVEHNQFLHDSSHVLRVQMYLLTSFTFRSFSQSLRQPLYLSLSMHEL